MAKSGQARLFPDFCERTEIPKPVNVASVPQRSPFRYPGGKTWFVPTFRHWIAQMDAKPRLLVEPFAGGGIISLTALFENLVEKVVMVELDDDVAAVWETLLNGDARWLANRVLAFDLTKEMVIQELRRPPATRRERAFQTLLRNRTLHGGILAQGSGFLKYGENGKGISSRWYARTLARRLLALDSIASRIQFRCDDGLKVMREFATDRDAVYFIDPPYSAGGKKAGTRLYTHSSLDHERLFALCQSLMGDFLMTYDDAEEVKAMARAHGFQMRLVPMANTHHTRMEELVVGRHLGWMDAFPAVHEPRAEYAARGRKPDLPKKGRAIK